MGYGSSSMYNGHSMSWRSSVYLLSCIIRYGRIKVVVVNTLGMRRTTDSKHGFAARLFQGCLHRLLPDVEYKGPHPCTTICHTESSGNRSYRYAHPTGNWHSSRRYCHIPTDHLL